MPIAVMILMISIILMFAVFGALIKYKKCYWLISGYNLMSSEKKRNVDAVGLGNFMGNFCFVMAGVLLAGTISNYFGIFIGFVLSIGSILLVVPYMLVKAQRYDNNSKRPDGKLKFSVIAIIVLIILVFAVAAGSMIYGGIENKVTVDNGYISIEGAYGMTIDLSRVSEISLVESIPEVKRKQNGYDLINILKGSFELEKIGPARLYIDKGTPPYIYMKIGDGTVIINFRESSKTQSLYKDITDKLKK